MYEDKNFEYSDPDDLLEYNQREEEDYFEDREDENYYGPYYPDDMIGVRRLN
jgi:hypothetical protein